jgi:hypothetical protein
MTPVHAARRTFPGAPEMLVGRLPPSQIDCDANYEFSRGTGARTIPEAIQKHTVIRLLEL